MWEIGVLERKRVRRWAAKLSEGHVMGECCTTRYKSWSCARCIAGPFLLLGERFGGVGIRSGSHGAPDDARCHYRRFSPPTLFRRRLQHPGLTCLKLESSYFRFQLAEKHVWLRMEFALICASGLNLDCSLDEIWGFYSWGNIIKCQF